MDYYCENHPDRIGIGICMRCYKVLCAECTTRLEGINHCQGCLGELAVRPIAVKEASRFGQYTVMVVIWAGLVGILYLAHGSLAP